MPAPKDPIKNALWRQRLSESHKGHKHTPEQKAKIGKAVSKAKLGVPRPDMVGDRNPMRRPEIVAQFKGPGNNRYVEVPTYGGAHDRVDAVRGRPPSHPCHANCGRQAMDWALLHHAKVIHQGEHPFSLDVDDYVALCRSCHKRYDLGSMDI